MKTIHFTILIFLTQFSLIAAVCGQVTPHKIAAIHPENADYNDLHFLREELKDVRIIGLGEQSHGDGATFEAKVRLIKYLHEELGYNVIAFESGLYDCTKANEIMEAGGGANENIFKAIFDTWNCEEVRKLADYMDECRKKGQPLTLAGFDCQLAGDFAKKDFITDFTQFINTTALATRQPILEDEITFADALRKHIKFSNFFTKLSAADTTILFNTISRLQQAIATHHLAGKEIAYWLQIADNILVDYRRKYGNFSLRDSIMASNLTLATNTIFKEKKIILWAASSHLAYNVNLVADKDFRKSSMGNDLRKSFGAAYYCMLFTSYTGKAKVGFLNLKVGQPAKDGLESYLKTIMQDYGYVSLRNRTADLCSHGANAKVFGHKALNMDLCHMADGVFYIEKMTPVRY
ncbi:erythromycin esterase-like protein [Chitinophaga dinghuensis]|uniref:Erythromycin esterase-like protein n=1 Tax=Chitinophaga dinghuensis TaxID=1539050 RepID=A0A327WEL1_9BACT|nr:erythromycin esterase family protein [Chitinophaga dinghuensis]RAJ87846.1 erythromycin esterase-like protein [Chitinophaga dinghuensis]